MGDPRRTRKTFSKPVHPWQKQRLEDEKSLVKQYGLKNKREVYKAGSQLKKFKDIAKGLVTKREEVQESEKEKLFGKLKALNLVSEESLDEVLGLQMPQLLDRRLQTIIYKKGLAKSMKQSRQMITHRHIYVDGKMISNPSYLVRISEEAKIDFYPGSSFADENHPERVNQGPSKTELEKSVEDKKEMKKGSKKEEPVKEEQSTKENPEKESEEVEKSEKEDQGKQDKKETESKEKDEEAEK